VMCCAALALRSCAVVEAVFGGVRGAGVRSKEALGARGSGVDLSGGTKP
jgi:hypothetical protein